MKNVTRKLILLSIVAVLSMAVACPSTPKTPKHKLAVYTADADAALIAVTEAAETLNGAGRLKAPAAKKLYQANLRVAAAVDILRDRAKTGFDKKEALAIIKQTVTDIREAEEAGVVTLDGKTRTQFLQITFWLQFTATSIQAVIEATKEPPLKQQDAEAASFTLNTSAREGDETVWSDLVLIAQRALLRGIEHSRMAEPDAFAAGEELSRQLKDNLKAKIAAIP